MDFIKGSLVNHFTPNCLQAIRKFQQIKVLVIGDVMLDRYWWGTVKRISPEAPVPILKIEKRSLALGGAGNVAANIRELGATPLLLGLIGCDDAGRELVDKLESCSISSKHLIRTIRKTTVKTRVVAQHQHMVRIDDECVDSLSQEDEVRLIESSLGLLARSNVVLLSDYAKGTLSQCLVKTIISAANKIRIPILVDPKGRDYMRYEGASVLTPNRNEAVLATGLDVDESHDINEIGKKLLSNIKVDSLLITLGEDGMALFQKSERMLQFPSFAREVYDVTGAGDTVISTLGVALGSGIGISEAAMLANIAAGLVVEQMGTTTIRLEKLIASLKGRVVEDV